MANYRRARAPGGTFFFTVVTYRRRPLFDRPESRDMLREVVREVRRRHPFTIDAWVLLPEHMHCIWTLPGEGSDFSMRWSLIKSGFSKRAKSLYHVDEWMNDSRQKHRETTIWQRRFWEHQIRDEEEYRVYMDYTYFNPVKHGLVKRVVDWPFSTFHRYVRLGVYPESWGGEMHEKLNMDLMGEG
jgi:putative transposase